MPPTRFQYHVHHPVTRVRLGQLEVRGASWSETVNGGTTFTGKVTVPEYSPVVAQIKELTKPYEAALYATPGAGLIGFGGPIINRQWDDATNSLTITAIDWKSWLYRVIVGPAANGSSTLTTNYSNAELLSIARDVVNRVTAEGAGAGVPPIEVGWFASGITRSFVLSGVSFKSVGAYLDELGGQANQGFEWEVEPYYASDGLPKPKVQFYIPQRGAVVPGLQFNKTLSGGNILRLEEFEEDASNVARRVWAVGEGPNAESTPWGADTDPGLALRYALRTDVATSYSGSLSRAQLARFARAEREYRADTLSGLTFLVRMDAPDWTTYGKGDRCRIRVQDRFLDVDVRNCRILTRQFDPETSTIKITANLNDRVMPEIDTGGSV